MYVFSFKLNLLCSGPRWLPFIGNTRDLQKVAKKLNGQHNVFDKWRKDYNTQTLGLKLGSENLVVVFDHLLAKEMTSNPVFMGRPDNYFLRLRTMGTR